MPNGRTGTSYRRIALTLRQRAARQQQAAAVGSAAAARTVPTCVRRCATSDPQLHSRRFRDGAVLSPVCHEECSSRCRWGYIRWWALSSSSLSRDRVVADEVAADFVGSARGCERLVRAAEPVDDHGRAAAVAGGGDVARRFRSQWASGDAAPAAPELRRVLHASNPLRLWRSAAPRCPAPMAVHSQDPCY